MTLLARLFEHNNWAHELLLEACAGLSAEQLDAKPDPNSAWTVREALAHAFEAQQGYVSLLTLPVEERERVSLAFEELPGSARASGETLLALARGDRAMPEAPIRTDDGYVFEPWIPLVQAINHATDHRRQICGMLRTLGVTPPRMDVWAYGESEGDFTPPP